MGVDHSDSEEAGRSSDFCVLCNSRILEKDLYKTKCGHGFHRKCISTHLKSKKTCPTCKAAGSGELTTRSDSFIAQKTRSQKLLSSQAEGESQGSEVMEKENQSRERGGEDLQSMVLDAVKSMQHELLTQLSEKMSNMIQSNLAARIPQPTHHSATDLGSSLDQLLGIDARQSNAGQNLSQANISPRSTATELFHRPDKVAHIMNGWKLRFSGDTGGISVDNFIYRVQALTGQTLDSKFDVMCSNASALFEGKASDFYWRYHKSVQSVKWSELCGALRRQFRDTRTDVDIRELIRDRKQKEKENFDSFYDAIVQLTDSLECPLNEKALIEILRRNLRAEIRHEILNIPTETISKLREICRRRECFLDEVKRNQVYKKDSLFKSHVSELLEDQHKVCESELFEDDDGAVEAISLICWNCRKEGHRYQDCTAPRKVFCYGCGARNTYKPSCQRCQKNLQQNTQVTRSRCVQKTQSTNTENEHL
ncbi:uncharacterized protein LOC128265919 [Drosophila gunungcola]|uniref:uncharacterized protein LOC128265919 n=1 Tax=Drosophila gunungcola TaxID=103775 RepID=UPI0022E60947|nr:uncharacterized protein LOC128265919 [Drosophila gunungcola]